MSRRVLLGGHAIASGRVVFDIFPVPDEEGIAPFLYKKGIEVRVPTLIGHCSSYRALAVATGEQWVEQFKQEIEKLLQDDEIEEYYFVGFSMGGLPIIIALLELIQAAGFQISRPVIIFNIFLNYRDKELLEKMQPSPNNKRHTGWRVLGYACVALTVLLVFAAILNIAGADGDPAENVGRMIGSILPPVAVGYLARYCFRRSKR